MIMLIIQSIFYMLLATLSIIMFRLAMNVKQSATNN